MDDVLFIGNGLNRVSDSIYSWTSLLDRVESEIRSKYLCSVPSKSEYKESLPLFFERLSESLNKHRVDSDEDLLEKLVFNAVSEIRPNFLHSLLQRTSFKTIITTNYDLVIEDSIDASIKATKKYNPIPNEIKTNMTTVSIVGEFNVWHVHGRLKEPKSIVISSSQYYQQLSDILNYLQTEFNTNNSWIYHMFENNIHILGYDLGYNEITILTVLIYRSMNLKNGKIKNRISYYVRSNEPINSDLEFFINRLSIDIIKVDEENYSLFYEKVLNKFIMK